MGANAKSAAASAAAQSFVPGCVGTMRIAALAIVAAMYSGRVCLRPFLPIVVAGPKACTHRRCRGSADRLLDVLGIGVGSLTVKLERVDFALGATVRGTLTLALTEPL